MNAGFTPMDIAYAPYSLLLDSRGTGQYSPRYLIRETWSIWEMCEKRSMQS